MEFYHGWIKTNKELLSKAFRKDMWTTGATDFSHPASHSEMKNPLMSWWHQLSGWSTTNLTSMFSLTHSIPALLALNAAKLTFGKESQASVLKSLLLPYDPYEMNIDFKVGSQIKHRPQTHPKHFANFNPNPPTHIYIYSNIISNLMAIIFEVNDSTEFLHHLKASRKSPEAKRMAMSKMDRSCDGFNLGSSSICKWRGSERQWMKFGQFKADFFFTDHPHWQKDNHPLSTKTKEYPFQTDTVPTEIKVWTILIDLSSAENEWCSLESPIFRAENWPVVESKQYNRMPQLISFRKTSGSRSSSTILLGFHKHLLPPQI